jgi:hypothetical protein
MNTEPDRLSTNFFKFFTILIIIIGLALASYQFFLNRSLWNDEATLSLNIIHRSPSGLLKPLDYQQVAPILFLQIEHFCFYFISDSTYGLRLFLLLIYFASIYLFYQILTLLIRNNLARLLALALFVFNSVIIYYSSEVKQYMADVFVGLLLYFFLLKHYRNEQNKYIILGIIGSTALFFSNISPILLFTISLFLIITSYKREVLPYLLMVFCAWGICFALDYYFFIFNHPSRTYMIGYWTNEKAFMPLNPMKGDFYKFLITKYQMIFYFLFGYGYFGKIFLPLILIMGFVKLYSSQKKEKAYILLIILPTIVQLILSAFKLYPFEKRLILYQFPILIIGVAIGIDFLLDLSKNKFGLASARINNTFAIILSVYLGSFVYFNGFPIMHTEIKESLKYIEHRAKKDQAIYVYEDLVPSFWFYHDINYIKFKNYISYGSYSPNPNDYLNKVTQLKGKVWLLLSNEGTNGSKFIINNLNKANCTRLDSFKYENASAYLYDLSALKNPVPDTSRKALLLHE